MKETTERTKTPADSAVDQHIYKVFPNDLNASYSIFGGVIMSICDRLALVVAERHSSRTCVTASVDSLHFMSPAKEGETLVFSAAINRAWTTSMEIGVKVTAENSFTGETRHIVSAYFTFVALDESDGPAPVPALTVTNKEEERRYSEAQLRRDARLRTRESINALRAEHQRMMPEGNAID